MSNMNLITLEMPLTTDTKVFSENSSGAEKESSSLFSNLMDKNIDHQQSDKNVTKNGKKESNHLDKNDKMVEKDSTSPDSPSIDSAKTVETQVKNESDNAINNETLVPTEEVVTESVDVSAEENNKLLIESSASNSTLPDSSLPNNTSPNSSLSNNPEQLLSFLNASEKVLNTKEGVNDSAIVLNKKVEAEFKSDKTLIAQSITKQAITEQVSDEDSSITKKINELLKKEDNESTDSSNKSTIKTDGKDDLLNDLASSEKKQASETKKTAAEENNDTKLNDKINNNKLTQEANLKANAETTIELSDKAIKPTPNQVTDIADKKTTVDSILAKQNIKNTENINEQSKPQAVSQTTEAMKNEEIIKTLVQPKAQVVSQTASQIDGKNIESKGEQKLVNSLPDSVLEESIETIEAESFDDKIKSVTTNNVVQNKFDQSVDRNKKLSQDQSLNKTSDMTLGNSDDVIEVATEVAIEAVKEELLNAELKPLNSNIKLNQSPNALFDSLVQREASNRIDGESFIESELSFENVMQTMSSDLAQTQKSTVIQQAETISIMRKDFTDAVKEKVMVMINQKIQQIDIQLDPPELGSMQVRINMQNEQAVVSFVVQNQQAKEALDQNMDRLKHMMADNGVDVGDANVKQESNQSAMDRQNDQGSNGQRENGEDGSLEGAMNTEHAKVLKASSTGVDYYV